MSEKTRKERELEEREAKILAYARKLVLAEGYHGLNMDRIAEALEYSKGTIYNHFPCKEEILAALAVSKADHRLMLFQRAAAFEGRPRIKMQAIGVAAELFAHTFPDHFITEQMIRLSSIWEKVSLTRQQAFETSELRCMNLLAGIVHQAIGNGDLELPPNFSAEDLVFGLWSLTSGGYSLAISNPNLKNLGVEDPYHSIRVLTNRLADGFQWEPLSSEFNFPEIAQKIQVDVFSNEVSQLSSISASADQVLD